MKKLIIQVINRVIRTINSSLKIKSFHFDVDDLRFSTLSFSQFGEDVMINNLLRNKRGNQGIYIDIGAFHPKLFSLTYLLYLQGWRGITIDANPKNIQNHKRVRPGDNALLAAVGPKREKAIFAEYSDPATNRLLFSKNGQNESITGLTPQKLTEVDVLPPMEILQNFDQNVDFLTIDCEGIDFEILKKIDLQMVNPYLIAIESHDEIESKEIAEYLEKFNYAMVGKFHFTYLFIHKS